MGSLIFWRHHLSPDESVSARKTKTKNDASYKLAVLREVLQNNFCTEAPCFNARGAVRFV
jgi:hypothetical protein